ncbi:ketopantoate reductase family protein [Roseomonas sp. CCTCC AB2023176]|uniref:ketopantoate reductase family protein n=1 Tax=Roseomonas sp. CCTCC AB2023176 TaxID=3342640 RepID=UPI0035DB7D33
MRIVALGSGGVGGFYGGLIAAAGTASVAFVARGAHLRAMRDHGLTIERDGGRPTLHVPNPVVAEDPAELGPADIVLLGVKLGDTEAATRAARPLVEGGAAIVSLQNGVTKDDALREAFGPAPVLGGVAYVASHVARPGVIAQTGPMARLLVGEHDGRRSGRAGALAEAARAAGVDAAVPPDIGVAMWQKFVFLVGLSGATATMRLPIGPIRDDPRARAFLRGLMEEAGAVGRAGGIALPAGEVDAAMARADAVSPAMTSSLHHDLEAGRPLEMPWLSGTVAGLGERQGIPTPCNAAVRAILSPRVGGWPDGAR